MVDLGPYGQAEPVVVPVTSRPRPIDVRRGPSSSARPQHALEGVSRPARDGHRSAGGRLDLAAGASTRPSSGAAISSSSMRGKASRMRGAGASAWFPLGTLLFENPVGSAMSVDDDHAAPLGKSGPSA